MAKKETATKSFVLRVDTATMEEKDISKRAYRGRL